MGSLMEIRRSIIASQPHLETENGSVVSFNSSISKAKDLMVNIEPVQEGTGDPSPDNVRPITGWTGAKVTKCGKNLFDPSILLVQSNIYSVNDDGSITVKAGNTSAWDFLPEIILPPGIYTISRDRNVGNTTVRDITANAGIAYMGNDSASNSSTFTVIEGHVIKIRAASGAPTYPITVSIQIELGSTATAYEPYVGSTYDITFPSAAGTVYGGTLDVVKGELVVDRAINVLNGTQALSDNGMQLYGGVQVRYIPSPAKKTADTAATQNSGLLSDKFSTSLAYTDSAYQLTGRSTNANVYINMPPTITTAALARAWFADNPTQLCYDLATPITYQLTPQGIALLRGNNTIYADCGDTTITYWTN